MQRFKSASSKQRFLSFRIGPADDDELLAIEPFGFPPEAAVAPSVGIIDRLAIKVPPDGSPLDDKPVFWSMYEVEGDLLSNRSFDGCLFTRLNSYL